MPKVLVVDDEPEYGSYLSNWLARDGHEVKTATSADDAIDFAKQWQPHVLVADWMLKSSLDGLQLSEAVRQANPGLQTILITGYASPELKARARAAKVFSFIEKPFSLAEMAGTVRRAANLGQPLFAGSVLVVSGATTIGEAACDVLHSSGYVAHLAMNAEQARHCAENDHDLAVAILDGVAPHVDMGILAHELRCLHPELIVIGSSEGQDRQLFAELGVDRFLPRFWEIDDLHAVLVSRIELCGECGIQLPLRRALPRMESRNWECTMCGAKYQAIMAEDATAEARRHVREVV